MNFISDSLKSTNVLSFFIGRGDSIILSVMQKDILKLLTEFKSLRFNQLLRYLNYHHKTTEFQCNTMLKQMRYLGLVQFRDDLVIRTHRKIDCINIQAFDIALDLSDGAINNIKAGKRPFVMMFTVPTEDNEEELIYAIVNAEAGREYDILMELSVASRKQIIIFMIQNIEQRKFLSVQEECYYALAVRDGKTKYFKSNHK